MSKESLPLVDLLHKVECEQYLPLFEAQEITADLLPAIDRNALKELGITSVGDRLRLELLIRSERIRQINERIKTQYDVILPDGSMKKVMVHTIAEIPLAVDFIEGRICVLRNGTIVDINDSEDITENEMRRLLVIKLGDTVTLEAMNVSNRIEKKGSKSRNEKEIGKFMGGRPPSELISGNLKEYFPELQKAELKRLSVCSGVNRWSVGSLDSFISLGSDVSVGIGKPLKIEESEGKIDLIDESDSDDGEFVDARDDEIRSWHCGPKIGQGSFGAVYLGLNTLTGELMAVKKVQRGDLAGEIALLKAVSHPNIVRFLGTQNGPGSETQIFLEYVPGGSVASLLKTYGPFEEGLVRNFSRQVSLAVQYLHSLNIVHRDIKGANVLVDNAGGVKLGDFGISRRVENVANKRLSLQGSVFWMAPEVVRQATGAPATKADVWAIACLAIEMYTGSHPHSGLSPTQALFRIGSNGAKPELPKQASKEGKEWLNKGLEEDWAARPTVDELLQMSFLTLTQ
ncbi:hypothetical protein CANINC_002960 [Pichia inconspicua]|uniref:mitogen-activated protein kinase kinase kinase n=1 Tax=Pichia inconspicua TaxID=52247 RepID=A0A4T0X1F3_9ASCO|nr:hypothetical protein CANINC_002960 [[Candida] inconspicua]